MCIWKSVPYHLWQKVKKTLKLAAQELPFILGKTSDTVCT